MEPATNLQARRERAATTLRGGEPSLVEAFEHLVSSSQHVVTKRIDLALLEARELAERSIERVALFGAAVVLATAMWFAAAWAFVLWITPDTWTLPAQLGVFAALHALAAGACIALALRRPFMPPAASLRPLGATNGARTAAPQGA